MHCSFGIKGKTMPTQTINNTITLLYFLLVYRSPYYNLITYINGSNNTLYRTLITLLKYLMKTNEKNLTLGV